MIYAALAAAIFVLYVAGAYVMADHLDYVDNAEPLADSNPLTNPVLTLSWPIIGVLLFCRDLRQHCAEAKERYWP